MEMGDKDEFEQDNRTNEPVNYLSNMASGWRFNGTNLSDTSMGLAATANPTVVRNNDLVVSSYSSTSMVDSTLWDHPTNLQNLGFCDNNVPNNVSTLKMSVINKGGPASSTGCIDRALDMGWNLPNPTMKGLFLPNMYGVPSPSLSQFPADSAFIERAARFSCFNIGNLGDIVTTPFNIAESMVLYSQGMGSVNGTQKSDLKIGEASKDVSLSIEHGANDKCSPMNDRRSESLLRSQAKEGIGGNNGSDDAEFSNDGCQDEPPIFEDPSKGLGLKKRKRGGQNSDQAREAPRQTGESVKNETENQQKEDENPGSATNKATGRQGTRALDPTKQEYIHVRARRGQATNSHSLAERVRREKISERMKFLQDLVPGCSKVTGKAVMLDEIINYVQSLQRQVEFLSMKLATVNPCLDFNIERLLSKDIFESRAGPSSTMEFSPEMHIAYPPLHPSQHGLIPAGLPCMGISPDVLLRTMNSHLTSMTSGFKEPTQVPNIWSNELHNVVQCYEPAPPSNSQDVDGSLPPGETKVELLSNAFSSI